MIFDTDVIIWCFRGNAKAVKIIDDTQLRSVCAVTYMELLQGVRNKQELRGIRAFLSELNIAIIPLTENIGHRAAIYLEEHVLPSGLTMADALIAATAMELALPLCTGNGKHFSCIADLDVNLFKP